MPTEEKTVDIDTSGKGAEIDIEEQKDESVVDTEAPKDICRALAKTLRKRRTKKTR